MNRSLPKLLALLGMLALVAASCAPAGPSQQQTQQPAAKKTTTPVQHMVIIYQENNSFDHYFGTYPHALNPAGEPQFMADPTTPSVNGLTTQLLDSNPNLANPRRLDRSMPISCDQDHEYVDEQATFDGGKMDKFVQHVGPACK